MYLTSDATRRVINIVHAAGRRQRPSLLLSIDEEKVFGRVHWTYMSLVLHRFGFQRTILSATLALYASPLSQVYTEGMLSKSFSISNGTKQGCPLSPTILILLIEWLAEKSTRIYRSQDSAFVTSTSCTVLGGKTSGLQNDGTSSNPLPI